MNVLVGGRRGDLHHRLKSRCKHVLQVDVGRGWSFVPPVTDSAPPISWVHLEKGGIGPVYKNESEKNTTLESTFEEVIFHCAWLVRCHALIRLCCDLSVCHKPGQMFA